MSAHTQVKRLSVPKLTERKGGQPLVCLTAYTAPMAKILDSHVDLLLVGDSLAQVVHGMESTVPVPLELMIFHAPPALVRHQRLVTPSQECLSPLSFVLEPVSRATTTAAFSLTCAC